MAAIKPYAIALCRPKITPVFEEGAFKKELLDANLSKIEKDIARAADEHGAKIIVFPEFGVTGFAPVDTSVWIDASISFPGPESDRIAQAAQKAGAYVLIQTAEKHEAFPGRYFLSAALYTPEGEVGLVHRKNFTHSLRTSPTDVTDQFIETFGEEALTSVLETPIGTIGVVIAAEVHWPEITRAMALKGAEIILNPIANLKGVDYLERKGAEFARPVRAFENIAYLAVTNVLEGEEEPHMYDYVGEAAACKKVDEELFLSTIDIEALRQTRNKRGFNLLAQIQPRLSADLSQIDLWPDNFLPDSSAQSYDTAFAKEAEIWRNLCAAGRGTLPDGEE